MRLDWIFLPRENPRAKFYIIIIIMIMIMVMIIIIIIIIIITITMPRLSEVSKV